MAIQIIDELESIQIEIGQRANHRRCAPQGVCNAAQIEAFGQGVMVRQKLKALGRRESLGDVLQRPFHCHAIDRGRLDGKPPF